GTTTLTTTVVGISGASQPTGAVSWLITDPNSQAVACTNPTGPVALSNVSTYTCTFTTSIAGIYHVTSTIASDSNYLAATSSSATINLGVATPTIFITDSPSNPTVGQPITFTAVVTGTTLLPAPTGTLTFNVSGAATSCTTTTGPIIGTNTATYSCQISTPIAGTFTATASYNGDGNYSSLGATNPISEIVAKATPTIAVVSSPVSPIFGGTI